jgi:ubiquinone/menaquinone biosynthesis C-methylase UbiE
MATVFMRWLERRPAQYERGIRMLTLGQLPRLADRLVAGHVMAGQRILEIGCGTGALTRKLVAAGARVTALDISSEMLAAARSSIPEPLRESAEFIHADAAQISSLFERGSFDRIVASLALSELAPASRRFVLRSAVPLLAEGGELLLIDEVVPAKRLERWLYRLVRIPMQVATWLLTRTTTHPMQAAQAELAAAGFDASMVASKVGGSLVLLVGRPLARAAMGDTGPAVLGQLVHRRTARTLLLDLWAVFLRLIPPYPHVEPGLYRIGTPDPSSPVLVTGNFDLTVRRLTAAIDGRLDAWVLVADSAGINVWCAAGGGFFTAESVIGALQTSGLQGYLKHHAMILPQLCANGVDGWRIRHATHWGVHWGPVRATDLPAYIESGRKKTDAMRWVRFPAADRLEMMAATLGFYALLILIPVALFWRAQFWSITAALLGLSAFYALAMPWIPGRDGLAKSVPLALIALAGMLAYTWALDPVPTPALFGRAIGMVALSVFVAAELQGMSPKMRGEQENWTWEALIGGALGLAYWLVPLAVGWR